MARLVVKSGPLSGKEFHFDRDVVVGRGEAADVLIDHPTISRRHAMLLFVGSGCLVSDLQSGNGTLLNGTRITEPNALKSGDRVQFGTVLCEFFVDGVESKVPEVKVGEEERPVLQRLGAENPVSSLLAGAENAQAIEALRKRLQVVYEVGNALSQAISEDATLSLILDKLFEVFPQAERGFVMVAREGQSDLVPKAARTRSGNPSPIAVSRSMIRDVISSREGILTIDATKDERFAARQTVQSLGLRSVLCVPLIANGEVYGIIQVDGSDSSTPFTRDDMVLLVGIAAQAALSLANARMHAKLLSRQLLEQDLLLAKKIQTRFLPKRAPIVSGYEFDAAYIPALEVGGDFYDYIDLRNDTWAIVAGDVSGKGISAALYMAKLSSELRYHSAGLSDAAEILRRVNRALSADLEEGMFATLVAVILDPKTHQIKIASAGHLSAYVRRTDRTVAALETPRNVPLGVLRDCVFLSSVHELQPGETVVLFTDGITEATSQDQQLFGEERLIRSIETAAGRPEAIVETVLADIHTFAGGEPQSDDITLVAFGPTASPHSPLPAGERGQG